LLAEKVVFAAGASGGLNLAVARRLAELGARVVLIGRDQGRIDAAALSIRDKGGSALGLVADVRDYARVEEAFATAAKTFGPVDIVISGAAGNFLAPAARLSANGFKTVIDIDLIGTFNVLRASFDHLTKPGASVISISAPQGTRPAPLQAHACAAKAGINMLTKVLALEWGEFGVRVNAISPGPIAGTEGVARLWPSEEALSELRDRIPLKTLGHPDDIAEAVVYLSSPSARYVTGTVLEIEGGYGLGA
jgi:hypothetical protein